MVFTVNLLIHGGFTVALGLFLYQTYFNMPTGNLIYLIPILAFFMYISKFKKISYKNLHAELWNEAQEEAEVAFKKAEKVIASLQDVALTTAAPTMKMMARIGLWNADFPIDTLSEDIKGISEALKSSGLSQEKIITLSEDYFNRLARSVSSPLFLYLRSIAFTMQNSLQKFQQKEIKGPVDAGDSKEAEAVTYEQEITMFNRGFERIKSAENYLILYQEIKSFIESDNFNEVQRTFLKQKFNIELNALKELATTKQDNPQMVCLAMRNRDLQADDSSLQGEELKIFSSKLMHRNPS